MIMEPKQSEHYNYFVVFSLLCSYSVAVMIKKLELHFLVVIRLNFGTPKLVCPKLVHQCRKQSVSTPGSFTENASFISFNEGIWSITKAH